MVFKNSNILDEKGNNKPATTASSNYLDHFLQAKFIWPITAILWNKSFLISIGFIFSSSSLLFYDYSPSSIAIGKSHDLIDPLSPLTRNYSGVMALKDKLEFSFAHNGLPNEVSVDFGARVLLSCH